MNLSELQGALKGLKPTATIVRDRRGQVHVEREELLSKSELEDQIKASVTAGKLRKGMPKDVETTRLPIFPIEPVKIYEFDTEQTKWIPTTETDCKIEKPTEVKRMVRVITFNVWFSEYRWQHRLESLVKLCLNDTAAEIVCLQEVTCRFLTKLLKYGVVRNRYRVVHNASRSYGVAMLLAKDSFWDYSISSVPLPTQMGRAALMAYVSSPVTLSTNKDDSDQKSSPSSFLIGTVHLESLNNEKIRSQQLSVLNEFMSSHDAAILCGDFNITSTGPWANLSEEKALLAEYLIGFQDLWVRCYPECDGFTFDTTQHKMQSCSFQDDASRYDRVCVRENSHVQCQNIKVIGDTPIAYKEDNGSDDDKVFISDHFGLYFEINVTV
mmetsp:Transcript_3510/g.5426  ORF Transcript_3510/g.5426 Transcript_3510/m.5426 type:complete len:382 (-) Transcript_3510:73-1218(-)|eukprot:CAMPEP_0178916268 /NCGR_PEP_ID=MMETSP0786-20121207/12526_1 /TAXON_ID=186022 /ORGANISM="Thalassionema frauenfeldii, Strain CCMP 1798" /LENGTH=381 /DNA_ID=CAMNT_0020589547 /DNA_START=115 /DNA_END=1260 /DNA_ORIENTATION=+